MASTQVPTGAVWAPYDPASYEPLVWKDTGTPLVGQAGFGAAGASNGTRAIVFQASISPIDRTPPAAIPLASVKTYLMPTEVDIQAAGAADDLQGVGVYEYLWYRDGQYVASTFTPEYSDMTVAAGSTHVYGLAATDYEGNTDPLTSFTITTPATAAVAPRAVGVRPTGSYWGAMGEQIDVRSGNLNYTYPLLTLVSRSSSLPLGLTCSSQNWRLDSNSNSSNLGADTGYGYGWQLQLGSITPYFSKSRSRRS